SSSGARGSPSLNTECPNPGSTCCHRRVSATASSGPLTAASTSNRYASSLAPPCSGPASAASPARTASYGSARVDAATRTATVDVASSWSASSTIAASTAPSTATCPGPVASGPVPASVGRRAAASRAATGPSPVANGAGGGTVPDPGGGPGGGP